MSHLLRVLFVEDSPGSGAAVEGVPDAPSLKVDSIAVIGQLIFADDDRR